MLEVYEVSALWFIGLAVRAGCGVCSGVLRASRVPRFRALLGAVPPFPFVPDRCTVASRSALPAGPGPARGTASRTRRADRERAPNRPVRLRNVRINFSTVHAPIIPGRIPGAARWSHGGLCLARPSARSRRQIESPPDGPAPRRELACGSCPPPSVSPLTRIPHGWEGACPLLRSQVHKDPSDELPHATRGWQEDGERR